MASPVGFLIRDGLESDLAACLNLNANYETEYVWQMSIREDSAFRNVVFKTERLPRTMRVKYAMSERDLRFALPPEQCFLVAVGKTQPETYGYLAMQTDLLHRTGLVFDLVVSEPYRRLHIGTRLLNVARRWASEHGLRRLTLVTQTKNYPAILFCQQMGLSFCGFNDQYFDNQDIAVFFSQTIARQV